MAHSFTTVVGTTTYNFDWVTQHIEIDAATTEIMAEDLKTAIHDAQDGTEGIWADQIAVFGNPVTLTANTSTFLNVILQDKWKIQSLATSGTLTIGSGNVVNVNSGIDIFVANPLVSMVNNVSASGVLVSSAGAKAEIAEAVWTYTG